MLGFEVPWSRAYLTQKLILEGCNCYMYCDWCMQPSKPWNLETQDQTMLRGFAPIYCSFDVSAEFGSGR